MPGGRLITIEGLDGAGKSTLAEGLLERLREGGLQIDLLREPGGAPLSERIRELVKDPGMEVDPRAEALLYAAARAQLVHERLLPTLAAGHWVLLDRFTDSSLAYQGAGRGLGMEPVRAVNLLATGELRPDLTLLLRVEPATGRERLHGRGAPSDRLEAENDGFFTAVARAYDELARSEPERFRVIDASRPADEVLAEALLAVEMLL